MRILEILTDGKAPAKAAKAKPDDTSAAETPAKPRAKKAETSE